MAKKIAKKVIVEVETGEVDGNLEELLDAQANIECSLAKAINRRIKAEGDISAMELSLKLIGEELDNLGYAGEVGE